MACGVGERGYDIASTLAMGSCSGGDCFDAGFPKAAKETKEVVSRLVRCWVMERLCVIPTICPGLPTLFDMLQ